MRRRGLLLLLCAWPLAVGAAPSFTEVTGAANPFDGVDVGKFSAPSFVDLDNDGDLDALLGDDAGQLNYYRNDGTATAPSFTAVTGAGNPMNGVDVGKNARPAFVDLDGDGDQDLAVGSDDGTLEYFRNVGTVTTPVFVSVALGAPLDAVTVLGADASPAFGDLDGDGDFDLMVGDDNGQFRYFLNTGTVNAPAYTEQVGAGNPMDGVDLGKGSAPLLHDMDADGDLDLITGDNDGSLHYYENQGTASVPSLVELAGIDDPFAGLDFGNASTPAAVDIDGDGDPDLFVGEQFGTVNFLRNEPAPAGAVQFNAVEVGSDAVTGVIRTRRSEVPFAVDIVALAGGAPDTGYKGTVTVEIVDARDDSAPLDGNGCRSSWNAVLNLGDQKILNADNGRITLAGIVYTDALRVARFRMTDTKDPNQGCSADAFAIRPDSFSLSATDQDAATAGTARTLNALTATATPTHRAGRPFTVRATALAPSAATTTGYDGVPTLSVDSSLLGATAGTLNPGTITTTAGVARTDTASYSEVGAFRLSVEDLSFTAVDSADGTPLVDRRIGPVTLDLGRFTPDDFTVSFNAPSLAAGCGGFSYIGQPFAWQQPPVATVTAVNAGLATTTNYAGSLFKLVAGSVTGKQYLVNTGVVDTAGLAAPEVSVLELGGGVAEITLDGALSSVLRLVRGAETLPYDAEIRVQARLADTDGVAHAANPFGVGQVTAGNGVAFTGSKQMRFGRLELVNAFGSDKLDLRLPIRVSYLASLFGGPGFVAAGDDSCTDGSTVAAGDYTLDETELGAGTPGQTAVTATTIAGGAGHALLSAPDVAGQVGVLLNLLPSYPWLQVDADNDGNYNENPSAIASFGLFDGDDREVFQQEMIR